MSSLFAVGGCNDISVKLCHLKLLIIVLFVTLLYSINIIILIIIITNIIILIYYSFSNNPLLQSSWCSDKFLTKAPLRSPEFQPIHRSVSTV